MTTAPANRRVALVTGSAGGLMRGVCVSLAVAGYAVAANYKPPRTHADDTVGLVQGAGGEAIALAADVAVPEQASRLVDASHERLGRLDVLVCGAGPMIVKDAFDMSLAEYRAMIEGNLGSAFYTIKAALPLMRAQGFGRIITFGMTGSEASMGMRRMAAYAAAKAGVVALTRSLALEEGPHGITCNTIDIGDIRDKDVDRAGAVARREYRNPTMRPGSWQDIGDAVVYLASERASFINGAVLNVNGGWQGFLAEFARWP
jgi:3-oxoacyl-[acyl-carrier protein] reductase